MAKNIYVGIGNKSKRIKNIYVGISNKAKKVVLSYVGVNDKARLCRESYSIQITYINTISVAYDNWENSLNVNDKYVVFGGAVGLQYTGQGYRNTIAFNSTLAKVNCANLYHNCYGLGSSTTSFGTTGVFATGSGTGVVGRTSSNITVYNSSLIRSNYALSQPTEDIEVSSTPSYCVCLNQNYYKVVDGSWTCIYVNKFDCFNSSFTRTTPSYETSTFSSPMNHTKIGNYAIFAQSKTNDYFYAVNNSLITTQIKDTETTAAFECNHGDMTSYGVFYRALSTYTKTLSLAFNSSLTISRFAQIQTYDGSGTFDNGDKTIKYNSKIEGFVGGLYASRNDEKSFICARLTNNLVWYRHLGSYDVNSRGGTSALYSPGDNMTRLGEYAIELVAPYNSRPKPTSITLYPYAVKVVG